MLEMVVAILLGWKEVFAQERTTHRAIRQALSSVCVVGRRTIARSILVREPELKSTDQDETEMEWSGEYKLYSRSPWGAQDLFGPILKEAIAMCPGPLLPMGTDDTRLGKTGKKIETAHWGRDPLSPPFRVNLQYGLRFLHTSVLLPLHGTDEVSARALPVWFEEVAPVKKPGKKASDAERDAYKQAIKQKNLSTEAVAMFQDMRERVDEANGKDKTLVFALDGSFTNRTTFRAELDRTALIGRTRKDAKLCWPATEGRRVYGVESFTPKSVMDDESVAWETARIFHGGKWRDVSYKQLNGVLWRRGGGQRKLRLFVVKPIPYRLTKNGRVMYREPAFLLCTQTEGEAAPLLQVYFDRWQVEVAHREFKDTFGVGQAQVRNKESVPRQPALSVATYSALHLAALKAFGSKRPACFGPLPPWQREKTRASCLELVRFLRNEVVKNSDLLAQFDLKITETSILAASAA